ncbi:MAG: hypothetical protein ACOYN8_01980 [Pseudanabaena sp.]
MDSFSNANAIAPLSIPNNLGAANIAPLSPFAPPYKTISSYSQSLSSDFDSAQYLNSEVIPAAELALQKFAISSSFSENIQEAFGYGCNVEIAPYTD